MEIQGFKSLKDILDRLFKADTCPSELEGNKDIYYKYCNYVQQKDEVNNG